jgi:hypothetical protein
MVSELDEPLGFFDVVAEEVLWTDAIVTLDE